MKVRIIESVREQFERKIAAFARKCKRLDIPFDYSVTGEEFWFYYYVESLSGYTSVFTVAATDTEKLEKLRRRHESLYPFKVIEYEVSEAEALKNGDYRVIGKIEVMISGNVVTPFADDIEIDKKFRTTDERCEHCGSLRSRKNLFVILDNKTGKQFQVGSSCLRYYSFGKTSDQIRAYYEFLSDSIIHDVGHSDFGGMSCESFGTPYYSVMEILECAITLTDVIGYRGSNSNYPTKYDIMTILLGYRQRKSNMRIADEINNTHNKHVITEEQLKAMFEESRREKAQEIINYFISKCESTENPSDFLWNVSTILKEKYVTSGKFGYLACLPNVYAKSQVQDTERKKKAEAAAKKEHFGEIKKRYTINVSEITGVSVLAQWDNDFGGVVTLYKIDTVKHTFVWKTSSYFNTDEMEKSKTLTFTVKEHGEYRGEKQTVISRAVLK